MTPSNDPYQQRMQRVLRHMEAHLDSALDVEALSNVAAFSRHHFQRLFSAFAGLGVHRYLQYLRLKRAAYRLAYRTDPVLGIALDSGYDGPEAFSRAFKRICGQTPSAFRKTPDWLPWQTAFAPIESTRRRFMTSPASHRIEIVDFAPLKVAALSHRGDHARLGDTIRRFIAWRKQHGLPPQRAATFNLLYGDPDDTPPDAFRLDLCVASDMAIGADADGIVSMTIPGGRCAKLHYTGTDAGMGEAIRYLYAQWLPASGEELRDFPLFVQRLRFFPDVAEHEAEVDIFLPLM